MNTKCLQCGEPYNSGGEASHQCYSNGWLKPKDTDKPGAPREFWVLPAWDKVSGDQGACFASKQAGLTHVIEKSAYDRVVAELEQCHKDIVNVSVGRLNETAAGEHILKLDRENYRLTKERDALSENLFISNKAAVDLAARIQALRAALERMYAIASPYMPCEDAWDDNDPLVIMVGVSQEALRKDGGSE